MKNLTKKYGDYIQIFLWHEKKQQYLWKNNSEHPEIIFKPKY